MNPLKLLHKKRIGKCSYSVQSDNKVNVREVKQGDQVVSLGITPMCKCGESLGEFLLDDPSPQIIEGLVLTRKQIEEKRRAIPYEAGIAKSVDTFCSVCGREAHASIFFNLEKSFLTPFFEKHEKGSETLNYGGVLSFKVSVDGGYFRETRQERTLQDLVNPLCNCGQTLNPPNLRLAAEDIIREVDEFFAGKRHMVMARKVLDKVKCPFCLLESIIRAEIVPQLPNKDNSVAEIVKSFQSWKQRLKA